MKRKLSFAGMLLGVLLAFQLQAQPWPNPEVLYYKFNGSGTTVPNDALSPPAGTATANIQGGVTQGGSGGKCATGALIGTGVTSTTDFLNTGWVTNLPSGGSWTISFWSADIPSSTTLYYIFGDGTANSFRCFTNGVAGANNWIIRGTGMNDVTVAGGATVAPHMTTFVYDATAGNMKGYLDGVLVTTVTQSTTMSFVGIGPFKVMGYNTNVGSPSGGKLDEFRLYSRALSDVEILGLYNGPTVSANSTPSPATVCPGANITLNGSGNGPGPYLWTDGTNTYTDNVPFAATVAGTYTVVAADAAGCTATSTLNVTLLTPPSVSASANPGTTICGNAPVTLQGSGASSYTWNGIATVGSDTLLNPAVAGTYTVTGVDANGCSATSTITISVGVAPFASNVSGCVGDAVQLSANGELLFNGTLNASSPIWNRPLAGIPPTTISAVGTAVYYSTYTFTVPVSGNYEIANTAASTFDGFGILYQNSFNPLTPLTNALDASDDEVYSDEPQITQNLTAGTTYIYVHTSFANGETGSFQVALKQLPSSTYNWYTQAVGGSAVETNNPFNPINDPEVVASGGVYANLTNSNTPGTYDFWVANSLTPDCRTQVTLTISIVPTVNASISSGTVCAGSAVTLSASGASSFNWSTGGSGSPITDYPTSSTTYTVTGTDGTCSSMSTVAVTVLPPGTPAPTITEDSVCFPGGVVNLIATGGVSNTWYDAPIGGNLLSSSSTYSPNISNTSTYYVQSSNTSLGPTTQATMPPQTGTFSTNARGYWFTAPADMVITGLSVPTTASSGAQNIAVLKFTGNAPPPVFSTTTNAFTVEYLTQNNSASGVIPVNINVAAGEVIGILGNRGNVSSYSNVGNTITINGTPVALSRLGMQFPLATTAPQQVWQEPSSANISRVDFEYSLVNLACPSFPRTPVTATLNPLPTVTATVSPTTTCANTSAIPTGGGAVSYVWDNSLIDGQSFIPPVGTTTYMVTGTDANGCSATSTINVTANAASGQLAAVTSSQTQSHGDDLDLDYSDAACNLIASVDDGVAGNILGLTSATVHVDATAGTHNGQPFVRRWYQISPASNGSADVVLYVNQSDFDDYNAVVLPPYLPMPTSGNNADPNIPNIRITKNDDAGLGTNPIVITPAVNWNGQYWELSFNTPSFSQFRIHSVNMFNAPLPVVVTDFKGQMLETSDLISWTTSSEINSDYFVVEYSQDAKNFQAIATVASQALQGNSQVALNYQIENKMPQSGHNYYRLKQVDLDKKSSYHAKVIDLIRAENNSLVRLYPNPANDVLHIQWNASKVAQVELKVLDMSGRTLQVTAIQSERGTQFASISLEGLPAGIYSLQLIENGSTRFTGRFTKN